MALFKKKKPADTADTGKGGVPAAPKTPKPPKQKVPADIYTLFLGLSAAFLLTAVIIMYLNYSWYQSNGVIPLTWTR
ncbi:MAG: hypothetical protein LBH00_08940 [Planctomycetaceae bacterium]|jgi:hypothetical protein|nr:hypothetical protein [Planctomycetaceae bacterium]